MAALILTLALAVGWALFVALGYWHGGWREIIALAGILISYAVLSEWAGPNGRDLSSAFHWGIARTVTGVALAYLLGGAAILGYGGSMLFPRPAPLTARERLLGALVGVLNGGLLLALALRVLRAYAFAPGKGTVLRDSPLSRFLIEEIGYVLLIAFIAGIGAVVAGFALSPRRQSVAEPAREERPAVPLSAGVPAQPEIAPEPTAAGGASNPEYGSAYASGNADPYAVAPVIDWPSTPPPGTRVARPASLHTQDPQARRLQPAPVRSQAPLAIPSAPHVPARIAPPMWHPVEAWENDAAHTKASPEGIVPRPLDVPSHVSAAIGSVPPSASGPPNRPLMPDMPPPGAPVSASPTTAARAEEPVRVRELATETRDSTPTPPDSEAHEREREDESSPPHIDVPLLRPTDARREQVLPAEEPHMPAIPANGRDTLSELAGDDVVPEPEPAPAEPVSRAREETPLRTTAAIPAVTPSPLPPVVPPASGATEAARLRGSYARVAQPRQAMNQPPQPASQPPRQPDPEPPMRPPIPTGPDVRPCPTCGYPVRPHAVFCPNCGHRVSR